VPRVNGFVFEPRAWVASQAQGATLQNYNNELVKCIEDLREKREEVNRAILKEEEVRCTTLPGRAGGRAPGKCVHLSSSFLWIVLLLLVAKCFQHIPRVTRVSCFMRLALRSAWCLQQQHVDRTNPTDPTAPITTPNTTSLRLSLVSLICIFLSFSLSLYPTTWPAIGPFLPLVVTPVIPRLSRACAWTSPPVAAGEGQDPKGPVHPDGPVVED